jgi:hypothetical protein
MAVLPDHYHLMIIREGDDVDPVPCFDDIEVMFAPRSGREGGIRSDGEDTKGSGGSRSNAFPRFDHWITPFLVPACGKQEGFHFIGSDKVCQLTLIFHFILRYKKEVSYAIKNFP